MVASGGSHQIVTTSSATRTAALRDTGHAIAALLFPGSDDLGRDGAVAALTLLDSRATASSRSRARKSGQSASVTQISA